MEVYVAVMLVRYRVSRVSSILRALTTWFSSKYSHTPLIMMLNSTLFMTIQCLNFFGAQTVVVGLLHEYSTFNKTMWYIMMNSLLHEYSTFNKTMWYIQHPKAPTLNRSGSNHKKWEKRSICWFIKHHGFWSRSKLLKGHLCVSISWWPWELELIGWTILCEMWIKANSWTTN